MPRPLRIAPAGVCFHVLNRGNNRQPLFRKQADYAAFVAILTQALERFKVDLLCWCLMPNHWHLLLRPRTDEALSRFMAWLSITHVRRHHGHYATFSGHLYQGRYKSFPVETDEYFLALCRYVESNPLRVKGLEAARLKQAREWRWSSLGQSTRAPGDDPPLAKWPVDRPSNWARLVEQVMEEHVTARIETSLRRDRPLKALSLRQRQRRKKEKATKWEVTHL